ncbi:MAG: M28 family peptidase [Bacteroidota bacterium]
MRYLALFILGTVLACNSYQRPVTDPEISVSSAPDPVQYASTITEAELRTHLFIYASDEYEGRETGEPGQKKAIEYLKAQYEALGIPPAQKNGDYFQKVPLEIGKVPVGTLQIGGKTFLVGDDILSFSGAVGEFNEIVYAGYGIEDGNYSDYQSDITGKVVLIKSGEPLNTDGAYVISGSDEKSVWSNVSEAIGKKRDLAVQKGAKGVLYYDQDNFARYKRYFNFMKNNNGGRMQVASEASDQFLILLNNRAVTSLISDISTKRDMEILKTQLTLAITSANEQIDSENVVAVMEGTSKPKEYVVISSHLDHIGITGGQINNGADDDGSGTVAMLEIAEAFKRAKDKGEGPERSIVFLHVTGEEKGLLGSKYYTDFDPIFPLENTVANLNIDMIGRMDPKRNGDRNYIYLIGSDKLSSDLHRLSEEINNKYCNLELDYTYNDENDPNRFYYRSDHYNFAKNNIPIIFYFNGTHADYHKPTDTPDKINYDLLANRTRLIFHTAWEVANRPTKVVVDKVAK